MARSICLLLLAVSLGTLGMAIAEDVPTIELYANGWFVAVLPDGSVTVARAQEANELLSVVQLPAGTVNFSELREMLKVDLKSVLIGS